MPEHTPVSRIPTTPFAVTPPRPAPPSAVPGDRPTSGLDGLFGAFWPEPPGSAALRVVVASVLVGVLAGTTMTFVGPGLAWTLVLAAAG